METERAVIRSLPVQLSDQQLSEMGRMIADKEIEIDQIESAKKRIKGLREEILNLSRLVEAGTQEQEIECTLRLNTPEVGKKTLLRNDTGEVVSVEPMTADELQENLEFQAGAEVGTKASILTLPANNDGKE